MWLNKGLVRRLLAQECTFKGNSPELSAGSGAVVAAAADAGAEVRDV